MADELPPFESECFVIAPIGPAGSEARDRSDGVLDYIISPAAAAIGLAAVRADRIAAPGLITNHVIEHILQAKAAVVDLTDVNPNVYYELAVRHTAQLPAVLIAERGTELPFDLLQMRTIFFEHTNLKSAADCKNEIIEHLNAALGGAVDSPIAAVVNLKSLEGGSQQDKALAGLLNSVEEMARSLRDISAGQNLVVGMMEERRVLAEAVVALGRNSYRNLYSTWTKLKSLNETEAADSDLAMLRDSMSRYLTSLHSLINAPALALRTGPRGQVEAMVLRGDLAQAPPVTTILTEPPFGEV